MATNLKANQIGEVLKALAYHDFEFLDCAVYIRDYDPGPLADENRIRAEANEQKEKHLHLHHGLSPDQDGDQEVQDDWCYQCTTEFLASSLGPFSEDILKASDRSGAKLRDAGCEKVVALTIRALRLLDDVSEKKMKEATDAVRIREGLGPADAGLLDRLIKEWDHDDDRVTDFYAERIGQKFPAMVDRAEKLNAIPVRIVVPSLVQRYLIEASRSYVFGQYIACLVVCRAAIELALGDYLKRNGQEAPLRRLQEQGRDGLSGRIYLAQSLDKWKLQFTLDFAKEIMKWAGIALHEKDVDSEKCKELFFKARGVLQDLYS